MVTKISPVAFPPPKPYELALANKFASHSSVRSPLMKLVTRLDVEKDGFIYKTNLKSGINLMWGIDMPQNEIDGIFERITLLQQHMNNKHITVDRINYIKFTQYLEWTVAASSVSQQYGAAQNFDDTVTLTRYNATNANVNTNVEHHANAKENAPSLTSLTQMRTRIHKIIKQHLSISKSSGVSSLFLKIDINRDNCITPLEFRTWIQRMGFDVSMEQLKALMDVHWKEDGMNLKQFMEYMEYLENMEREVIHSTAYDPVVE